MVATAYDAIPPVAGRVADTTRVVIATRYTKDWVEWGQSSGGVVLVSPRHAFRRGPAAKTVQSSILRYLEE